MNEQDREWIEFKKRLGKYCFNRMASFLEDTDADREFQISKVDKKQEMQRICQMANVWIPFSSLTINPEFEDLFVAVSQEPERSSLKVGRSFGFYFGNQRRSVVKILDTN